MDSTNNFTVVIPDWFKILSMYGIHPEIHWLEQYESWAFALKFETKCEGYLLRSNDPLNDYYYWRVVNLRHNLETPVSYFSCVAEVFKREYRVRNFGSSNWLKMLEKYGFIEVRYKKEYKL